MRTQAAVFLLIITVLLFACEKKPSLPPVIPAPTSEDGYTGIGEPSSAKNTKNPAPVESLVAAAPATVNLDVEDKENRLVKEEVLKRIDVMPNLTDDEKDKLYVQVERARAMGKVITIPFASGEHQLQASATNSLLQSLKLPQIEKFSQDPTIVFVVLGYADKKGDQKTNIAISMQRANAIVKVLKEKAEVMNVIHAVGMGSSEMFDSASLDKNRVVEVWAVLP